MKYKPANNVNSRAKSPAKVGAWHPGVAAFVLGLGVAARVALADGVSDPATPPTNSNSSAQNIAITPAVKPEKLIVLPQYEVNGLRERLDAREKIIEKEDSQFWAGFMRLDNGMLVDNILFLCKYRAAHPNEFARLVLWQGSNPVTSNEYHYGIGEIADTRMISGFLVYTSGDDLHARNTLWGDRIFGFFKASQIRNLTDRQLRAATGDMINITQGYEGRTQIVTHKNEVAQSVAGDDPNLQVRYAEAKLKEVGVTAFVVPATDQTGPNNDLMLVFCANGNFFVWRPYYGAYHLSKDAYAKFGIREVANAAAK